MSSVVNYNTTRRHDKPSSGLVSHTKVWTISASNFGAYDRRTLVFAFGGPQRMPEPRGQRRATHVQGLWRARSGNMVSRIWVTLGLIPPQGQGGARDRKGRSCRPLRPCLCLQQASQDEVAANSPGMMAAACPHMH